MVTVVWEDETRRARALIDAQMCCQIWQQALVVYHWPLAAVASLSLVVSVLTVIAALSYLGRRSSGRVHG